MKYGVNHIQMIKNNDDTDDEIAVNDYLVQNIK